LRVLLNLSPDFQGSISSQIEMIGAQRFFGVFGIILLHKLT